MSTEDNQYNQQIKNMSKADKDKYVEKLLKQQEKAREKSATLAANKKASGIKPLTIDLPEIEIIKFKELLNITHSNKTTLFIKMLNSYYKMVQNNVAINK